MIELLITTFQLLLRGKLFRDPRYVFTRLALCNVAVAIIVIAATAVQAAPWLLLLLVAALGAVVPYVLRHVKYQ
jgi:hypothetical protein